MTILGLADPDSGDDHGQGAPRLRPTWTIERFLIVRGSAVVMLSQKSGKAVVAVYRYCDSRAVWDHTYTTTTPEGAEPGYRRRVIVVEFTQHGPDAHFPPTEQGWYDAARFAETIGTA